MRDLLYFATCLFILILVGAVVAQTKAKLSLVYEGVDYSFELTVLSPFEINSRCDPLTNPQNLNTEDGILILVNGASYMQQVELERDYNMTAVIIPQNNAGYSRASKSLAFFGSSDLNEISTMSLTFNSSLVACIDMNESNPIGAFISVSYLMQILNLATCAVSVIFASIALRYIPYSPLSGERHRIILALQIIANLVRIIQQVDPNGIRLLFPFVLNRLIETLPFCLIFSSELLLVLQWHDALRTDLSMQSKLTHKARIRYHLFISAFIAVDIIIGSLRAAEIAQTQLFIVIITLYGAFSLALLIFTIFTSHQIVTRVRNSLVSELTKQRRTKRMLKFFLLLAITMSLVSIMCVLFLAMRLYVYTWSYYYAMSVLCLVVHLISLITTTLYWMNGHNTTTLKPVVVARLRECFALVTQEDPEAVSNEFYRRLFHQYPAIRTMFPDNMNHQKMNFMKMLNLVIQSLHNVGKLRSRLIMLGARHEKYGAKPEHYQIVRTICIEVIQDLAGDKWVPQWSNDWNQAFDVIIEAMQQGSAPTVDILVTM